MKLNYICIDLTFILLYNQIMSVKKFHQFVRLEKGPVNTAIIDFLKGNVYHIGTDLVRKFEEKKYDEIGEFMDSLEEEELIFAVDEEDWIPSESEEEREDDLFRIEIAGDIDIHFILEKFKQYRISAVIVDQSRISESLPEGYRFEVREAAANDFKTCEGLARRVGSSALFKTDEQTYAFLQKYNRCWGKSVAVTSDGKIRPCIHSQIILGDINESEERIHDVIEKMKELWGLTTDKVKKCKACELRYVCFDCRELAFRNGEEISAINPFCQYNPNFSDNE